MRIAPYKLSSILITVKPNKSFLFKAHCEVGQQDTSNSYNGKEKASLNRDGFSMLCTDFLVMCVITRTVVISARKILHGY